MATAIFSRISNRTRVVLTFGLAGVVTGWGSERILEWWTLLPLIGPLPAIERGIPLLPGLLLLLGLVAALAYCQGIGWLSLKRSVWRSLVAVPLVTLNGLWGLLAGILAGFWAGRIVVAALEHKLAGGRPIVSAVFLVFGVVVGILSSVFMLSLALYVFVDRWHRQGMVALLVCAFGATAISFGVVPNFIPIALWGPKGDVATLALDRFLQVLLFLTHALYSGCAGYWLSQTTGGENGAT